MPNRVEVVKLSGGASCPVVDLSRVPQDVTAEDQERFRTIINTELSREERERIETPERSYPMQDAVLAVHWHPEFVPMSAIMTRVSRMYPNQVDKQKRLLIPTQHNVLLSLDGYAGVEVDCFSSGFNRKVQLLLHFKEENVAHAGVLKAMLAHTFRYRSSQLFELMDALQESASFQEERRQKAAAETGATEEVVGFCLIMATKLKTLLEDNWAQVPADMIKNKLVRNFLAELTPIYGARFIERCQLYARAVKKLVKQDFSLKYFYRASEVIEEARSLNAGVVIPHPEQFWPILLRDYDVDGIEVWNPQSLEYTEFLINVVNERNKAKRNGERRVLVFMGDDCHMGEKVKPVEARDPEKGSREIGYQPPWDDMAIRKSLVLTGVSRQGIIREYKERLA